MACVMKTSTLPSLLKEYDSDYVPNYNTKNQPLSQTSTNSGKQNLGQASPSGGSESQEAHLQHAPSESPPKSSKHPSHREGAQSALPEGDKVQEKKHHSSRAKAETERYCQLTANWEEAKRGVQAERHDALKEKVALQRELIRVQDSAALQRRQTLQKEQDKAKKQAREQKQAKQAELQQICRQSLEDDKQRVARRRPQVRGGEGGQQAQDSSSNASQGSRTQGNGKGSGSPEGCQVPQAVPQGSQPTPKRVGHLRQGARVVRSPNLPKSPMLELENEDDTEDEAKAEVDVDSLPWHHAQLYRLYGSQAEYFIHPKMEPPVKEVNPRLKKHSAPYIGAEKLWDTLREESKLKIRSEDRRFPKELKEAFSAFVRESLGEDKKPVKRNFCASEDVPEMDRLLDQSRIQRVKLLKHRREIMYRSSKNNMDRTNVLVYNNPLPSLGEDDSPVGRYLPSWADEEGEVGKDGAGETGTGRSEPEKKSLPAVQDETLNIILRDLHRPRQPPPPQYHFLTERESSVPGTFSEKFKQDRENKNRPAPHTMGVKAQSSLGFTEHRPSQNGLPGPLTDRAPSRALSAQEEVWRHCLSNWEPLSLSALVEYKPEKVAAGDGSFRNGATSVWPVVMSPS